MSRTLVLVRHAHRDKTQGRELDNGLSAKGKRQAIRLGRFFKKRFPTETPVLLSSPKKRCIETLIPISRKCRCEIKASGLLDEFEPHEFNGTKRLTKFFQFWTNHRAPLMVISSHGDWIPAFIKEVLGIHVELKKGAWAEIEFHQETPNLTWLVQDFKYLRI